MTTESEMLQHLEEAYRSTPEQQQVWLAANELPLQNFLNSIFLENDGIDFRFPLLLERYRRQTGGTFAELILEMLKAGEQYKEGDWDFESTIVVGALEVAKKLDLA